MGFVLEERAQLGLYVGLRLELFQGDRYRLLLAPRPRRVVEEPSAVHGTHRAGSDTCVHDDLTVAAIDLRSGPQRATCRARRLQALAVRANRRALRELRVAL